MNFSRQERYCIGVPNCEVCGASEESIKHVLLDCSVAKCFWNEMKALTGIKVPPLHPLTWARDIIDPALVTGKDAAVILCGMWSLWTARNQRRHGERGIPLKLAVQWATDTAFDMWQTLHPAKIAGNISSSPRTWQKPPSGWIKANVDAAFYSRDSSAASGVVIRDEDGRTCGGRAKWYEFCLNALTAEATACRDGLQLAQERGVQHLQLETDCQVLFFFFCDTSAC